MMSSDVMTTVEAPVSEAETPALPDFLLPAGLPENIKCWYQTVVDRGLITQVDCQTIRDLLQLSGLSQETIANPALHALLIALFAECGKGSVCLPLDKEVLKNVFAEFAEDPADDLADEAHQMHGSDPWSPLIGAPCSPVQPLIESDAKLYFQKYYCHEKSLAEKLGELRTRELSSGSTETPLKDLCTTIDNVAQYDGFSLNALQKLAVYLACRNRFTVISGGPGTGKTTLVASLIRALVEIEGLDPDRICLIAPTGRAGQRMGESLRVSLDTATITDEEDLGSLTELKGSTIHRVLKYNPRKHAFTHGPSHPIPYDLVICDEVSMVDIVMMDRLLAAIPENARVVFLGDKNQLPSVQAGAVLGDLVPKDCQPVYSAAVIDATRDLVGDVQLQSEPHNPLMDKIVLLEESHRATGEVWEFAKSANDGKSDCANKLPVCELQTARPGHETVYSVEWDSYEQATCNRIEPEEYAGPMIRGLTESWVEHFMCAGDDSYQKAVKLRLPDNSTDPEFEWDCQLRRSLNSLFDALSQSQILTLVRKGPYGCESLNRHLVKTWRKEFDSSAAASSPVFAGMPIMITRNDHFYHLYNGDVGIVLRLKTKGSYVAVFQRGENDFFVLPVERLPEWEPAFAITVHKSQGSEYGNVFMILPDERDHPLLTREILYTGVTRSKDKVFIFSSAEMLQTAISRQIQRYSGLALDGSG
jgi:exodeoxyribonuclease V alpha subunit